MSPLPFSGKCEDTETFIHSCILYINGRPSEFGTEQNKVTWILSHMQTGSVLDTLSPKTSGTLRETRKERRIVYIDSGEYLREYNWGVTTNYLSIYMIVHVVTTRLAYDVQPSISQLY